jgi:four helix bundle protein
LPVPVARYPLSDIRCQYLLPVAPLPVSRFPFPVSRFPFPVVSGCGIRWLRAAERWHFPIARNEEFGVADFRKLRVWQVAQEIAIDAHRVTARMRGAGSAVLRDQLMRAAMSVPTNIVEGSAHASPREFARFIQYALASVSELEGHIQLARDVELMAEQDFTPFLARIVDVRKMLHGLLKKLKSTANGQRESGVGKRKTDNG